MSDAPHRIQRRRSTGWRMPHGAVYVGRPTVWQNPYGLPGSKAMIIEATREDCVRAHREMVAGECAAMGRVPAYIRQLRGKVLACWCRLDQRCHADTLLRLANGPPMAFPEPLPDMRILDPRQTTLICEAQPPYDGPWPPPEAFRDGHCRGCGMPAGDDFESYCPGWCLKFADAGKEPGRD